MKNQFIISILVLAVGLFSCSEDDSVSDLTKPEILAFTINGTLEGMPVAQAGSNMVVAFSFSDANGLSQARMDIHDAFDGHAHGRTSALQKLQWENVLNLNGSVLYADQLSVAIDENTLAGPYHFDVMVTDKAGNESEILLTDFIITNAAMAQISVAIPANFESAEIETAPGAGLTLNFTVTDAVGLEEIYVKIHPEHEHEHSGRTSEGEEEFELLHIEHEALEGLTSYTVDQTFTLPTELTAGEHYKIEISVTDKEGNISFKSAILHVE